MNQQYLIYGANGWIGTKVCSYLKANNFDYYPAMSRADDVDEVMEELNQYPNLTHVMSFIGRTHGIYEGEKISTIDYLEKPGKLVENIKDNLFSPISLALLCRERDIHFTYLGTGCIFEYDKDHIIGSKSGFNEENEPNFFGSSYSIVKGFTDRLMHLLDENTLNVRIRMPITDEFNDRNFISKIVKYKKICSIPNSMTCLDELIPIMVDMAENNHVGTVNLTNPGVIDHNEILEMYQEIVDPYHRWENFSIEEQNQILLSKRSNNFMETIKLQTIYPHVKHIRESIRDVLLSMRLQINNSIRDSIREQNMSVSSKYIDGKNDIEL